MDEMEPELCLAGCDQDGGIGEKPERCGLERLTGRDTGQVIACCCAVSGAPPIRDVGPK